MLPRLLFLSFLSLAACKECQKRLPGVCTTCCAVMYDNDDCETQNLFRVKWDADGFLGAIWERQPRVVEVYNGCLLTLWEMRNQTGQSRVLGLDGVPVHYLDRYSFSQRASSLACKCTSAAGKPPATTPRPEENKEKEKEGDTPPVPVIESNQSIDIPVPKGDDSDTDSESGYGSEPEGRLEEVKSLEDTGTGEEEEKEKKQDSEDSKEKEDDGSREDSREEIEVPTTTVHPNHLNDTEAGSDVAPAPSEFSVPSIDHPIVGITLTPPIREIPLTIERLLMPKSDNATL